MSKIKKMRWPRIEVSLTVRNMPTASPANVRALVLWLRNVADGLENDDYRRSCGARWKVRADVGLMIGDVVTDGVFWTEPNNV